MKWVEWVSVARPSLYPALENRKNGEDEWMSKWVSAWVREKEKEKEGCTWLRLCCPLSPPQRQMTGGGSEGVNKRPQAPQGVRGPSVNPSISQSINHHNHSALEQKTPALSSLSSHPASKTTLSDAPWLSPSKNRKLLCHTHTPTYIHTLPHFFSIITVCCNEKSQ